MKKVAVIFHGELRHWEQSSKVFKLWNNLYEDIKFDFYLSTWKDHQTKNIEKTLNFTDISLHSHEEMYKNMAPPLKFYFKNIKQSRGIPCYQHYYSFLLSKAVKLFKQNSNQYDATLLTRPDVFIFRPLIDFIKNKLNFNVENETNNTVAFGDKIIYSKSGSTYSQNRLFCNNDTLFLGSSRGIIKFGEIYNDIFVKQIFPPIHLHSLQAEYLNWKRIFHKKCGELDHYLIRNIDNAKPGWPTPEGIQEALDTYSVDLLNHINYMNIKNIFSEKTS